MAARLDPTDRAFLLGLARQGLDCAVTGAPRPDLIPADLPERAREPGACFVTLTAGSQLRGCVGTMEPSPTLAENVLSNAIAAALADPRFPEVAAEELEGISIEISVLTPLIPLIYNQPEELLACLHPGEDGVLLRDGLQRATFLPKVWEKIPAPEAFLSQLCLKMGVEADLWRQRVLEAFVYHTEDFSE